MMRRLVFNMQLGFAFLEAGSVSVKATIATLFKVCALILPTFGSWALERL